MKKTKSRYFDEAYFILSDQAAADTKNKTDLAEEAERLVQEACRTFTPPPRTVFFGRTAAFALGAASSSAVIGTVALLLGLS